MIERNRMAGYSCYLGVDIGGTKTALALMNGRGCILRQTSAVTVKAPANQWAQSLCDRIDGFLLDQPIAGIGIGMKGMVAADLKTVVHSSVLDESQPVDFCKPLQERYQVPCLVDNDVHAAALAEARFGAGRRYPDFIYINLGTGLAAGIVSHGALLRGANNLAGELGITAELRWEDGKAYLLESLVSGAGLAGEAARLHSRYPASAISKRISWQETVTAKDILRAHREGDVLAAEVMRRFMDTLLRVLVNMSLLFNPSAFVFGGGLASDGYILELLREPYANACNPVYRAEMTLSPLGGNEAGVIGAACLCLSGQDNEKEGIV